MRSLRLHQLLSVTLFCILATAMTTGVARAGGGTLEPPKTPIADATTLPAADSLWSSSELLDVSHQLSDIQKKISELQKKGQYTRLGPLSLAATCGFDAPSQIFHPWADLAFYSPLRGDGVWTTKSVTTSADHDPYTSGYGSFVLANQKAQLTSPTACVNLDHPTIRLFLKHKGGDARSTLNVSVIYEKTDGKMAKLMIAKLRAGSSWQPSAVIPIGVTILSTASASGITAVAFQFQPANLQPGESWSVDSLYVDPYVSR